MTTAAHRVGGITDRGRRTAADRRADRLAELVAELADCDDDVARQAIEERPAQADPLEQVARALTAIRHRTEPQDRLRIAGFLRHLHPTLPRRPRPGAVSVADRAEDHLAHHGSLRRWDRTDRDGARAGDRSGATERDDLERFDQDGEPIIDLRDRTARFRRPR